MSEKQARKVYMVYGYGEGAPWFPALQEYLEKYGCTVKIVKMPRPWFPSVKQWVWTLRRSVPHPDQNTYLIGYSIGASTVLRYIEEMKGKDKLGGVVTVAFFSQYQLLSWLPTVITRGIRKGKLQDKYNKLAVVQSSNDWRAPVSNGKWLTRNASCTLKVAHKSGHFDHDLTLHPKIIEAVQEAIINA